jgi:hypothetical protein
MITNRFLDKVLRPPDRIKEYEEVYQQLAPNGKLSSDAKCKDLDKFLLDIIVQRRLYRDQSLEFFFSKVRNHCILSQTQVEKAIKSVRKVLEC